MDWLFRRFSLSEDLGIDLGTANTLVASQDRGIILDEPSVVAVYKGTNEVILDGMGVGDEAYRMLGKTPTDCCCRRWCLDRLFLDSALPRWSQRSSAALLLAKGT